EIMLKYLWMKLYSVVSNTVLLGRNISMQKTHKVERKLSFEFANASGEVTPILFRNPLKVIEANTVEGVLQSLEKVQEAVNSGYYAAGFLTYESAAAFDSAYKVKNKTDMPLLWFG